MKIKDLPNMIKKEFDKVFNVTFMSDVCTGGLLSITLEIENNIPNKNIIFREIEKVFKHLKFSKFLEIEEIHIHKNDIVISIQNNFNIEIDYIDGYYYIQR